jgi:hypothetical protein
MTMHPRVKRQDHGSSIVIVVSVVATILVLLGAGVAYTQHVSRQTQRSRKSALAMEIADGHLEHLFTYWRNLSRIQVNQAIKKKASKITSYSLPTQYFFTDLYNPGPAPTPSLAVEGLSAAPPIIPLPDKSLFPTEANYSVTQYRIQAVDPMVELQTGNVSDPELSTVPVSDMGTGDNTSQFDAAFGPNTSTTNGQYSFYYLASVDVKVPAIGNSSGFVTTKVRRVFEKKYDQPFTFAVLYMDDLELQPAGNLTITGPIHTNGSLYIGTSKFTAATPTTTYPTSGRVTFSNMFVNGASSQDPVHTSFSAPNFPDREPPMMWPSFLPFGWDPNLTGTNNNNNDNYHELIEVGDPAASDDPISAVRFSKVADYVVLIDANNNVTVTSNGTYSASDANVITGALTFNESFQDVREGGPIRVTTLDLSQLNKNNFPVKGMNYTPAGPMIYIADTSAGTSVTFTPSGGSSVTTTKRAIRIKNGTNIFTPGMAIISGNPIYIQGDLNTATWKPTVIIGDAINVLSNNWGDRTATASRVASNTTVNAALIGGIVASNGANYSGGAENFIRLLENWSGKTFTYTGSIVQMWQSNQGAGVWTGSSTVYTAPSTYIWTYDTRLATATLPGTFTLAAYLQQQRWYQVY